MSDTTPRPSQTTMAAGMVIGGSAMVVVTVGEQLAGLNSLETREVVADFLSTSPGTGLDVSSALVALRAVLMVLAGCATAALVLGVHVLRRSRGARLGLTLLAAPLFLTGLASGGFLTVLVAVASLLLWVEPSRAWLDRRPLPQLSPPATGQPAATTRDDAPRATPWTPPAAPPGPSQPPPHQGSFGLPAPPLPLGPPGAQRPPALVWACALTWGFGALALALLGASLTLLLSDPSLVWAELQRQDPALLEASGLTREDLLRTAYLTLGLGLVWSLLAVVLAVLAFRRRPAGRMGLLVCAGIAGVACLVGSFGAVTLMIPTLGCLATVVLLLRPEVGAWVAGRPQRP